MTNDTPEAVADLIARVEAASGPNILLDDDISEAVGISVYRKPLRYTASIDAAMTLVPEGWNWGGSFGRTNIVALTEPSLNPMHEPADYEATAATPALALTAAALRAILTTEPTP